MSHALQVDLSLSLTCPSCWVPLSPSMAGEWRCEHCPRDYPLTAGLPDLRLRSDRYLTLAADRAKAERLHAIAQDTDVMALASAYYAITDDVLDHRRQRFLRHIAGALARGEALAERLPSRGRILEVGCGTGGLLVAAARMGRTIEGVDLASRWLVIARRRLKDHGLNVSLLAAEAERLPYPSQTFDAVVADSVLEHLDDPARAVAEWRRVLRPGGRLIVWSPNRYTLTTDPHLGLWGVGWLPRRAVPAYLRLRNRRDWPPATLSASEARRLARRSGFERVSTAPAAIPERWAQSRPPRERLPIRLYQAACKVAPARAIVTMIGPLWELSAETKGAA
jgi:ubiquinone/menaquinone biosynthesis C-methylase UbiE